MKRRFDEKALHLPYIHLSFRPSVCLTVHMTVRLLSIRLSIHSSYHLSVSISSCILRAMCSPSCLSIYLHLHQSVCKFVHLATCFSIYPSVRPPINLAVCPFICMSILSVHSIICKFICPSIYLSAHLCVCPSICLFVCQSVRLSYYNSLED